MDQSTSDRLGHTWSCDLVSHVGDRNYAQVQREIRVRSFHRDTSEALVTTRRSSWSQVDDGRHEKGHLNNNNRGSQSLANETGYSGLT